MTNQVLTYKTYYDINRLCIWADSEGAEPGAKRARMVFSLRDGNPRITVYTGETGGVISFPCDPLFFGGFLETLKFIVEAPNGTRESIESLSVIYEDNKPTNQLRVVATLHVGKSKDGIIYLSVMTEGKPKLAFTLKTSPYHVFRGEDKNPLPADVLSKRLALGLINTLYPLLANYVQQYTNEEYTHGERKPAEIKGYGAPKPKTSSIDDKLMQDLDELDL